MLLSFVFFFIHVHEPTNVMLKRIYKLEALHTLFWCEESDYSAVPHPTCLTTFKMEILSILKHKDSFGKSENLSKKKLQKF